MWMPEDLEFHLADMVNVAETMGGLLNGILQALRQSNEIAERSADLDLRMTNIHVQALELARVPRSCPHCL